MVGKEQEEGEGGWNLGGRQDVAEDHQGACSGRGSIGQDKGLGFY